MARLASVLLQQALKQNDRMIFTVEARVNISFFLQSPDSIEDVIIYLTVLLQHPIYLKNEKKINWREDEIEIN